MIRRTVGALVGAEIDRTHGRSGVKGALIGAVATGVLRRMGPLGGEEGAGSEAGEGLSGDDVMRVSRVTSDRSAPPPAGRP